MGVFRPEIVMKNMIPVIMSGILGIYGLIVSVILFNGSIFFIFYIVKKPTPEGNQYSSYEAYAHLGSGLSCGLSCLAAGLSLGICGDAGCRAIGQQQSLFISVLLMLIFGEALALYGVIVAIILATADADVCN